VINYNIAWHIWRDLSVVGSYDNGQVLVCFESAKTGDERTKICWQISY